MGVKFPKFAMVILAVLALLWPAGARAAEKGGLGFTRVELKAGHSLVAKLPRPVARVSVGRPEVADVLMITTQQLYLNGRGPGTSNVTLWDQKDNLLGVFEVRVARDLTRLKEQLHQIMPGEPIEVRELEGAVVLSGRVSSLEAKARAEAVAKAFEPKNLASLLQPGGSQQVMLKVRFAEVSRRALNKLNFNLGFMNSAGDFAFTLLQGLITPTKTVIGTDSFSTEFNFSSQMKGMWGFKVGGSKVLGFLDALKEDGLAKVLAEPNLVATSGQKAEFLAGGEYPIPVPQKENITIEFKKFGVQLAFTPEILDSGKVRLLVEPEVSELDYSTAVVIQSFSVPGLTTRKAKTMLELDPGQSFAIAGLFRDDITQTVAKLPLLGDMPVLGALFRSNDFQSKKTELVIVVTPEMAGPGSGQGVPPERLPGEDFVAPGELELYLLAKLAGPPERTAAPAAPAAPAGRSQPPAPPAPPAVAPPLEGGFGHDLVY